MKEGDSSYSVVREDFNRVGKNFGSFSKRRGKQLFNITEGLVDYLHDNGVKALVLPDRSARPVWVAVDEYWKIMFPEEERPDIFFINPDGFKRHGDLANHSLADKSKFRFDNEIKSDFLEKYKALFGHKEQRVLLFDVCIHSGETISPVIRFMRKVGFSKLEFGVGRDSGENNSLVDFELLPSVKETCHSFGKDCFFGKPLDSVSSTLNTTDKYFARKKTESRQLRQEIRSIVRNNMSSV